MPKIYFFILLVLTSLHALADEPTIIDVRRNITLADDDTVYKDFYINVGEGSGLKKNLVVTAVRKLSVRDASGSQAFGEVMIPVGQLRVIAIYNKIAVAREYKLLSRDELPMLEQIGIMTGDKINLQGSFIDNTKPKYPKHKIAEQPPSNSVNSAAATPAAAPVVAAPTTAPAAPSAPVAAAATTPAAAKAPASPVAKTPTATPPAAVTMTNAPPAVTTGPAPASVASAPMPSENAKTETAHSEKGADSGENSTL